MGGEDGDGIEFPSVQVRKSLDAYRARVTRVSDSRVRRGEQK